MQTMLRQSISLVVMATAMSIATITQDVEGFSSPSKLGTGVHFRQKQNLICDTSLSRLAPTTLSSSSSDEVFTSIDGSTSTALEKDKGTPSISFTSSPMRVYIEDTDAYGIIYYANYLRMFERALFAASHSTKELQSLLGNNPNWSIVAVGHQKFVSSPILGSDVVIHGQLQKTIATSENENPSNDHKEPPRLWSVWNMEMRSPDGTKIYNVVTDLVVASDPVVDNLMEVKDILPEGALEDGSLIKRDTKTIGVSWHDTFTIQRDELDAHSSGLVPLRNTLSYFERGRTNTFGGPNNLQKMQEEDGILAVVTSVRGLSPVWGDVDGVWQPLNLVAGQQVDLTSTMQVKRKVRRTKYSKYTLKSVLTVSFLPLLVGDDCRISSITVVASERGTNNGQGTSESHDDRCQYPAADKVTAMGKRLIASSRLNLWASVYIVKTNHFD
jgi:acyl-CoA thioesterase FadM